MRALAASMVKEFLLLGRDLTGLLVLFLMPAVLVVVISLVQENVLKSTGETQTTILFINRDKSDLSDRFEKELHKSGMVVPLSEIDGKPLTETTAKKLLNKGKFQFCILIPENMGDAMKKRAAEQIAESLGRPKGEGKNSPPEPELVILFDPMVHGAFRSAILNAMNRVMLAMEMKIKAEAVSRILSERLKMLDSEFSAMAGQGMGGAGLPESMAFPVMDSGWAENRLVDIKAISASREGAGKLPTSVQQNVPAFSLFGMFFIVIPLAGSIIQERQGGTFLRLLTVPPSYLVLLSGKMIAYVLVCLLQFTIILLMGKFVMPLFGTPELTIGSSRWAIVAVVFSASLAAAGYGVLLGTAGRTYEQASMFGALSIVIAAALGGIMVPVYVMPAVMRQISGFSPLNWGLDALTDIFVREAGVADVFPQISCLLIFFAANLMISRIIFIKRHRAGRLSI